MEDRVSSGLGDARIARIGNASEGRTVVQLSWPAYFKEFCIQHGRWSVVYRGRLLFQDGWSYSSTSYAGPEWPSPTDEKELKSLLLVYWRRRWEIVKPLRDDLKARVENLKQQESLRQVPLQQRTIWWDQENGKYASSTEPVDWGGLLSRLDWLEQDVRDCEEKIKELTTPEVRSA